MNTNEINKAVLNYQSKAIAHGNMIILVGIFLQAGILIGGFLLEKTNFIYLYRAKVS